MPKGAAAWLLFVSGPVRFSTRALCVLQAKCAKSTAMRSLTAEAVVTDCRGDPLMSFLVPVRWVIAALLLAGETGAFAAAAPLYDSTRLNIGLNCRWEQTCISAQTRAMERGLAYVKSHRPPQSSIHLCNRNARRARYRVDWIGFYNCIRNPYLHYR